MKLTTFLMLVTLAQVSAKSFSQGITLSVKNAQLKNVFEEISKQADISIVCGTMELKTALPVTIDIRNASLEQVLNECLKGQPLEYEIDSGKRIVKIKKKDSRGNYILPFYYVADTTTNLAGKITDANGAPIPGATVKVKETGAGAVTGTDGSFNIKGVKPGDYTLVISSMGFTNEEIRISTTDAGSQNVKVTLKNDTKQIEEVIVTGVFDQRTRMSSSIAISSISTAQLEKQTPVSAADLLKNVPGVFVNSSLGEIRNVVYSRGVSANSSDGDRGYYYVSMQEDGLPVTNVTYGNFGPDYFLRADATISKVEAVRGGSASITGPNAPGGIFNYLSKSGAEKFGGEARLKLGLEGDGNPYYRADLSFGGPLKDKSWTYNIGGFYRYDMGARNPGYPVNYGGQIKANIVKKYKTGSVKFYAKYLNDHNSWFEFSPAVNFKNPQFAPGVKNTDTYIPNKNFKFSYPYNSSSYDQHFDVTDLAHAKEASAGIDWNQQLGKGWAINNNIKYSNKSTNWNTGAIITTVGIESVYPYLFANTLGRNGTYTFTDLTTGSQIAKVIADNGTYTLTGSNAIPGQDVQANSLMLQGLYLNRNKVNEVFDQFSINKKLNNMSFTAGSYFARSSVDATAGLAGAGYGTIENNPHPIGITLTENDGNVYQVTDPTGAAGMGRTSFTRNVVTQTQLAAFFAHNWQITPKLNLDWGVRYDNMHVKGTNTFSVAGTASTTGGVDGDALTLYDNYYTQTGPSASYDKTVSVFSYSAALNYKFADQYALYTRFSNGKKAPDLLYYNSATTQFTVETLNPKAQDLKQLEMGFKANFDALRFALTPFYSLLSNIATQTTAQNTDGTYYNTPVVLNKMETYGVELEADYSITAHFNLRGVLTLQKATAKEWKVWKVGNSGPDDDVTIDYSGNKADNNPSVMFNLTPSYTNGRFYASLNWKYMGDRPANVPNTFTLPGFSQFDLGGGYDINKHFKISANINNLLNGKGVMGWQAPGGFPASLDRQGFLPETLAANPNATFSILTIQPRAYFLTATYKF
ncbi:TonB-dependent receptor [Chitinophaga sp.]|uniref:TonB-dependent receptor n=1 Tax=Chitinophaga sp. TaxID=1869181 RepID=UPI0031D06DF3